VTGPLIAALRLPLQPKVLAMAGAKIAELGNALSDHCRQLL